MEDGDTPTDAHLIVDGAPVAVADLSATLLDVLRTNGITSVKDGCAPQGQCGCCTVLIDGQARVACVTPVRRVVGKSVTTAAGIDDADEWAKAFWQCGASQCGFCTPGIIVRLSGLLDKKPEATRTDLDRALAAHLCRCTGWNTIFDAWETRVGLGADNALSERDLDAVATRASLEGHNPQLLSPELCLGAPVFAGDTAPPDALVALQSPEGAWVVGEDLLDARRKADKIQGRRTTLDPFYPVPVPDGEWAATLQTTWVEPAYLETDASWCSPGGEPASPLANGGAFGAKTDSPVSDVARRFADEHGQPVLALMSREDTVRLGPKRPPIGGGVRSDGTGVILIGADEATTATIAARVAELDATAGLEVRSHPVAGPRTSAAIRGAGIVEALALVSAIGEPGAPVRCATGAGGAEVAIAADGSIEVRVNAGEPLDETMLRSYVIGAVHMGLSLVRSEALAVDTDGQVHDLTIRSFGVLRVSEMPEVSVTIEPSTADPVGVSDAVFAATAAAVWRSAGAPPRWPIGLASPR